MPVAEKPQHLQALERANELRLARTKERRQLRGKPQREITRALIYPTEALASYRLGELFAPVNCNGVLVHFNRHYLTKALALAAEMSGLRRINWHPELRLRDLSESERRRLAKAIFEVAPNTKGTE